VQETVLRAISKQEQFEAGTTLEAWLVTILRNSSFRITASPRAKSTMGIDPMPQR
jgi:DNA-directed RNA polymerase specialized sigma24 family protein